MLVTSADEFATAADKLRGTGPLLIDTETSGLEMFAKDNPARMVGMAIGLLDDPSADCYIAIRHGEGPNVPLELLPQLRELVAGRKIVNFNLAFDMRIMHCDGFELPPEIEDLMIHAHQANENEESFALKKLAKKYLGADSDAEEQALYAELKTRGYKGKEAKGSMWRLPAALVAPYAVKDIVLVRELRKFYAPVLERWRLTRLAAERNQYRMALTRMELRGLPLDIEEIHRQLASIEPRLEEICARIRVLAGRDINLNSPRQLKEWLGLASTKKEILEDLVLNDRREDVLLLLEYRQLSKAATAFFLPLLEKVSDKGLIHSNFNCARPVTQRLASSSPNAQQLTRNSAGRKFSVRNVFVAPADCFLVDVDLSAIEPRVAAGYSQDAGMIAAFKQNLDVHARAARAIYRKEKISDEERTSAKVLSLGVLYFLGATKAARKLGLRHDKDENGQWIFHHSLAWAFKDEQLVQLPCSAIDVEYCTCEGRGYINNFHGGWPMLKPFMTSVTRQAETFGYIRVPLTGAVRRFPDRKKAHKAFNSIIQMTAGEILRRAFVAMDAEFDGNDDVKILLTVHDSIVLAVRYGPSATGYVRRIKEIMETTTEWNVPTVSEVKVGLSLGNLGKVDL